MSYTKFRKQGRYCIRNKRTKKVTCYGSEKKRKNGIRLREAFAHGFKPTRVKKHSRMAKGRTVKVKSHSRKVKKRISRKNRFTFFGPSKKEGEISFDDLDMMSPEEREDFDRRMIDEQIGEERERRNFELNHPSQFEDLDEIRDLTFEQLADRDTEEEDE